MARVRLLLLVTVIALLTTGCTMLGGGDEDDDDTPPTSGITTDPSFPPVTTPPTNATPTTPATPTEPTTNGTLDSSTYALAVAGVPGQAKPNARVNFTLFVNGSLTRESDHIGGHFADNDTTNPPATGRRDCEHVSGTLPGTYTVTCPLADIGTWYVWGHARINETGTPLNWWTSQASIVKVRDYNLSLSGVPTNAQTSGSNFTVQSNVSAVGASDNATSDHIGIHFWNATQPNPSVQNSEGACVHVAGGVVGNHTITCNITNAGLTPKDYFIRGHVRVVEGGTTLEWWSAEQKISILGSLPGSPI